MWEVSIFLSFIPVHLEFFFIMDYLSLDYEQRSPINNMIGKYASKLFLLE